MLALALWGEVRVECGFDNLGPAHPVPLLVSSGLGGAELVDLGEQGGWEGNADFAEAWLVRHVGFPFRVLFLPTSLLCFS